MYKKDKLCYYFGKSTNLYLRKQRGVIPIKKIVIVLAILIFLLGAWLTYTKRNEQTTDFKTYQPNEIEEALSNLNFSIGLPSYIPEDYTFYGATIFETEEVRAISLSYQVTEDDIYEIAASPLEESIEEKVKELSEFTWEETKINDYPAYQSISKDTKEKRIIFKTEADTFYSMYAKSTKKSDKMLTIDEMKEILASIE